MKSCSGKSVKTQNKPTTFFAKASAFFAAADLDRLLKEMIMFIDDHR